MRGVCAIEGCDKPALARGWCAKHYQRWRVHGNPSAPSPQDLTVEERFWAKVDKAEDCWLWTSAKDRDGYGVFTLWPRQIRAHRFSYELSSGPIPQGMVVMHLCDVRPCVNPAHLRLGTHAENSADAARKGRRLSGSQNHQAKLTESEVFAMRAKYAAGGINHRDLAREYGVSIALVSHILTRKAWRHI